MTYDSSGGTRLNGSERREAARAKAKGLREQRKKREKRGRFLLQGGLGLGVIVIVAAIVAILVIANKPAGPGPLNMISDGITIGKSLKAVPTAALDPQQSPEPTKLDAKAGVVSIRIYVDYFCPFCSKFEATNDSQMRAWLDRGAATVEIHPIAILNQNSLGTQYSTRSANAAACVANYSPDAFWKVNTALFAKQPKEQTGGLTDDQLASVVRSVGVPNMAAISACIHDQTFKTWVKAASTRALDGPIPNSNLKKLNVTPTVLVNGIRYEGSVADADAFAAFVLQAAGQSLNQTSTSTPTPTPVSTPTK